MEKDSFLELERRLLPYLKNSRHGHLKIREKIGIGLYFLSHGDTVRQDADKFGRSESTIVKCRNQFIDAIMKSSLRSISVFDNWVWRNCTGNEIPTNDNFYGVFRGCVGALDGSHFPMNVPASDADRFRNRKQVTSTNVLIVCDFNEKISFVTVGGEGCAHDGFVLNHSRFFPLMMNRLPEGIFVLGDAGYSLILKRLLTPYRGVRYHLKEYDEVNPPQNYKELFNLRHATLRSVIERTIGRVKRRWGVFKGIGEYQQKTYFNCIIVACLLHNFLVDQNDIRDFDAGYEHDEEDEDDLQADDIFDYIEATQEAKQWRDRIALALWAQYQAHAN